MKSQHIYKLRIVKAMHTQREIHNTNDLTLDGKNSKIIFHVSPSTTKAKSGQI